MKLSAADDSHLIETRHLIAANVGALAALTGMLGIAGWLANGDSLLLSVMQSGLAWCM